MRNKVAQRKLIPTKVTEGTHIPVRNIVVPSCSAILVVETRKERIRTIKEYTKQRNALREFLP